jgi:hypothetical protein
MHPATTLMAAPPHPAAGIVKLSKVPRQGSPSLKIERSNISKDQAKRI